MIRLLLFHLGMKSNVILGVEFFETTLESILVQIKKAWENEGRLRVATVNPEFLVATEKDRNLRENLQSADIKVVDGFGLYLTLRLRGWQGKRVTGVDLTEALLRECQKENRSVLIVLKSGGLSLVERVKEVVIKKYPSLSLDVVYYSNSPLPAADITLLTLGIPEQEYVAEKISKGVVIGVGGSIDFLTGAQKRAPKMLQSLGLEWLWRLVLQPKRFKRIWNAVIVFPTLVILR